MIDLIDICIVYSPVTVKDRRLNYHAKRKREKLLVLAKTQLIYYINHLPNETRV